MSVKYTAFGIGILVAVVFVAASSAPGMIDVHRRCTANRSRAAPRPRPSAYLADAPTGRYSHPAIAVQPPSLDRRGV